MKTNTKAGYLLIFIFLLLACKKDVKPDAESKLEEDAERALVTLSNNFLYWDESVTLTFDLTKGNRELLHYSGDLYLHAGLIRNSALLEKEWTEVVTDWDKNADTYKLKRALDGTYSIAIRPADFFKSTPSEDITHIAFLVRNADGSRVLRNADATDMYWPVSSKHKPDLAFKAPAVQPTYIQRTDKQEFAIGEELHVLLQASQSGTITLFVDGKQIGRVQGSELKYNLKLEKSGEQRIEARIEANGEYSTRFLHVFVKGGLEIAELPEGIRKNGVTIHADKKEVSFALTAPSKSSVFLIGDFNGFTAASDYAMKRTADGNTWWITLRNLDFGEKYTYQFLVDGKLKIADPYARMVLDPDHDEEILGRAENQPSYPHGRTEGLVAVLSPLESTYIWNNPSFQRPHMYDLIIYELHVRDFLDKRNYQTLRDSISYLKRLGVNAVELMPIQEFEGNSSWGYNPSFHFALDKYYGTTNALKAFIDECHQEGIAVIVDMVLNHAFGQSPMVRLYEVQSGELLNSPWFNSEPTHPFNVGYDFNHESPFTQQFTKDVIAFWMDEFKLDGFRFDLSKGFTQKKSGTAENAVDHWSAYDASRVAIWKNYNNFIRERDQDFYVILEHFADDKEEQELAREGMLLWNNLNYVFNEATMGWLDNANLTRLFPDTHGFEKPQLVSYMESHDEERLLFKNLLYGNAHANYSTKDFATALDRMKQAATFLLCAPGPKMIWQFGELGYDISIEENGRTGEKPLKWDYLKNPDRYRLFTHYAKLIRWKRHNSIFRNAVVKHKVDGAVKFYRLKDGGQEILIIGNFDVVAHEFLLPIDLRKSWYDNLSETTRNWRVRDSITLGAGEYCILSINKLNN